MAETITLKALREAVTEDLGLLIDTSIDAVVDGDTLTINAMADETPDAQKLQDAYIYQSAAWRRVLSFGYPSNNNVELARTGSFSPGAAQVYFMLNPRELNASINEALQELYYEEVETIALVADTYVYNLPTWMQQRTQFIAIKWRDTTVLSTDPKEEHVGSFTIKEDVNALTIKINDLLRDVTTWDLQVYGRRNYASLASDAATTTCPRPLALAAGKVKVLHKIFQKYGKGVANLFGPKMAVAEQELAVAKADWLPKLKPREYVEEEAWAGPDTNEFFDSPSW